MYAKLSACRYVYNSVLKNIKDPLIAEIMCGKDRAENLKLKLDGVQCSDEERSRYSALMALDTDLVIFVRLEMDLTFDDATKKIVGLSLKGIMTSVQPAKINCSSCTHTSE